MQNPELFRNCDETRTIDVLNRFIKRECTHFCFVVVTFNDDNHDNESDDNHNILLVC